MASCREAGCDRAALAAPSAQLLSCLPFWDSPMQRGTKKHHNPADPAFRIGYWWSVPRSVSWRIGNATHRKARPTTRRRQQLTDRPIIDKTALFAFSVAALTTPPKPSWNRHSGDPTPPVSESTGLSHGYLRFERERMSVFSTKNEAIESSADWRISSAVSSRSKRIAMR